MSPHVATLHGPLQRDAVEARRMVSVKRRSLWKWTIGWMRATKLGIERQQEDERKLVRLDEQVATMTDSHAKLEARRDLLATQVSGGGSYSRPGVVLGLPLSTTRLNLLPNRHPQVTFFSSSLARSSRSQPGRWEGGVHPLKRGQPLNGDFAVSRVSKFT
mgnify:CR=1 FL=1